MRNRLFVLDFERVTVVVVQVQNEFLPDPLFRLACRISPFVVEDRLVILNEVHRMPAT